MHDPEKGLLKSLAEGDENAFRTLFNLYHQQLGAYILRITNDRELTEEIVQDVFLKVWLNHKIFANVLSFKAYLFVLSKNHTLNYLRKVTREQLLKTAYQKETLSTIAEQDTEDLNYQKLLDKAIDRLPEQQQKVYLLSRHKRLKYHEIAHQLNLSKETVKKYLQIATTSITTYVKSGLEIIIFYLLLFFS